MELGQKALWFKDGKCLVLEFSHRPGMWDIPGGRVARGEDIGEAFRREILEEIGLTEWRRLGIAGYTIVNRVKKPILLIASVIESPEELTRLSDEHTAHRWVTRSELSEVTFLHPEVQALVEQGFDVIEKDHG